jgi:hypothetical protein
MSYTVLDVLKYQAAIGKSHIEWATDYISGNVYHGLSDDAARQIEDVLEHPIETIDEYAKGILAAVLDVEPDFTLSEGRYSDGRRLTSSVQIETGMTFSHTWHYDASKGPQEPFWIRGGELGADPGQYAGSYAVMVDPSTQTLEVEKHKSTFSYYAEPVAAIPDFIASVGVGEFSGVEGAPGREAIALDIGDSMDRKFVYIDADQADALADALRDAAGVMRGRDGDA